MTTPRPAPPTPPYATDIPNRRPVFKTHNRVEHAKNAVIGYHRLGVDGFLSDMTIFRLADGQYVPWIEITKGSHREDYPELAPKPTPLSQLKWQLADIERWRTEKFELSEYSQRRYDQLTEEITRREAERAGRRREEPR